jgi:hypothetical protein
MGEKEFEEDYLARYTGLVRDVRLLLRYAVALVSESGMSGESGALDAMPAAIVIEESSEPEAEQEPPVSSPRSILPTPQQALDQGGSADEQDGLPSAEDSGIPGISIHEEARQIIREATHEIEQPRGPRKDLTNEEVRLVNEVFEGVDEEVEMWVEEASKSYEKSIEAIIGVTSDLDEARDMAEEVRKDGVRIRMRFEDMRRTREELKVTDETNWKRQAETSRRVTEAAEQIRTDMNIVRGSLNSVGEDRNREWWGTGKGTF